MLKRNFVKLGLLALALPLAAALPAHADTVVKVSLWDKGGMMDMSKSMGLGMGMHGNMKMAIMGIKIDKQSIPAGKVTFDVINAAKETIHEMLVAPVAEENTCCPSSKTKTASMRKKPAISARSPNSNPASPAPSQST